MITDRKNSFGSTDLPTFKQLFKSSTRHPSNYRKSSTKWFHSTFAAKKNLSQERKQFYRRPKKTKKDRKHSNQRSKVFWKTEFNHFYRSVRLINTEHSDGGGDWFINNEHFFFSIWINIDPEGKYLRKINNFSNPQQGIHQTTEILQQNDFNQLSLQRRICLCKGNNFTDEPKKKKNKKKTENARSKDQRFPENTLYIWNNLWYSDESNLPRVLYG